MILQLRRWLPNRHIVVVADSSYAAIDLLHFCQSMTRPVTFIARLRLDAALYEPVPPRRPGQMGRPRLKGHRLPTLRTLLDCPDTRWMSAALAWYDGVNSDYGVQLSNSALVSCGQAPCAHSMGAHPRPSTDSCDTQALLCTDTTVAPVQIIKWFVLRWQIEVTFQEARAHLGVETQRQWSDRAIARTTPVLLGLFSWITLAAHLLGNQCLGTPRSAAWYAKSEPTFVDAIALVRRHLWFASATFCMSSQKPGYATNSDARCSTGS